MSSIKAIKTSPDTWDFYSVAQDAFIGAGTFYDLDEQKQTGNFRWKLSNFAAGHNVYTDIAAFVASEAIFNRNLRAVKTSSYLSDRGGRAAYTAAGFLEGREYNLGGRRAIRLSCDRYDLVRKICESLMAQHLDLKVWGFGFDNAKRRLGACHWEDHRLTLSRYLVDLHTLDEIDQVMRHEIAHALAGSDAGHSAKWKRIATSIGYRHVKISGEQIGDATAKLIGTCPSGHKVYRHRRPKTLMSCSKCAGTFDKRFLISWVSR